MFCKPFKNSDLRQDPSSSFQAWSSDLPVNGRGNDQFQQGVLLKRRDIFTSQWRARWFILDEQNGNLIYYIFSRGRPQPITTETHKRQANVTYSDVAPGPNNNAMPRGIICLGGCHIRVDDDISQPEDNIFAFTIFSVKDESTICCLASSTAESRDNWVREIAYVCEENSDSGSLYSIISSYSETEKPGSIPKQFQGKMDKMKSAKRNLQIEERGLSPVAESDTFLDSEEDETIETSFRNQSNILVGIIMLTPLVIYNIIDGNSKEIAFLISAVVALRTATLLNLGTAIPVSKIACTRTVSCHFKVNIKKILRDLPQLKLQNESRESINLSILSVAAKAVGRAVSEIDEINSKRAEIPFLGIKGHFLRLGSDVSILGSSNGKSEQPVTLANVTDLSFDKIFAQIENGTSKPTVIGWLRKSISNLDAMFKLGLWDDSSTGSCLVISALDTDGDGTDFRVAPGDNFNAVVVVGGLTFVRQSSKTFDSSRDVVTSSKPVLSISVTVDCPVCSIADCQRFVEDIQELLEDPQIL